MADIQHADIPDPYIHEPKGIASAGANTVYVANGAGSGAFLTYYDLSTANIVPEYEELLVSTNYSTQAPAGLDSTYKVLFGSAAGGPSDPVQIDGLGNITFNEAGTYAVVSKLQVGRATGTGTAIVHTRKKLNGVVIGDPDTTMITQVNVIYQIQRVDWVVATFGDILTLEFVRDPAGNNSGSLRSSVATAAGWGTSPSATVRIGRINNAV